MSAPNTQPDNQGQPASPPPLVYPPLPVYPPPQAYPLPQVYPPPQAYPLPEAYPPQTYPPEPPYQYKERPQQYPQTGGYVTTVVTAQPAATTTVVAPKGEEYSGLTTAALVLSIVTLICCGCSVVVLLCILPALCLAIIAMTDDGAQKKQHATVSLTLSITAIVCYVILLVSVVAIGVVVSTTSGCLSYYNYRYGVTCTGTRYSRGCYYTGYGC